MVSICKLILVSIKKERDSRRSAENQRDFLESSDEDDNHEENPTNEMPESANGAASGETVRKF